MFLKNTQLIYSTLTILSTGKKSFATLAQTIESLHYFYHHNEKSDNSNLQLSVNTITTHSTVQLSSSRTLLRTIFMRNLEYSAIA
jgi:hypothetical protein